MAAVVFGAVYATVIAVHGVWSSRVFEDHPSAGLAAVNTALTIGTLAGPTLAGIVIQQADYRAALVIVAFLTLARVAVQPADGSAQGSCSPPTPARQRRSGPDVSLIAADRPPC